MTDTNVNASMSIAELCDAIADKGPGIGSRYHRRISRATAAQTGHCVLCGDVGDMILHQTLANPYTRASIQTIKRHMQSPRGLCHTSALRLLRRNVRDAAPGTTRAIQWAIAGEVLELIKRGEV